MRFASYRDIRMPNLSVRILRDVLGGAGLDYLAAFQAAGLDPDIAEYPGSVVTGEQELAFQLKFVELTARRTDLWIEAGQGYSLASLGVHGLAIATAPTLTHWVEVVMEMDVAYAMAEFSSIHNSHGALTGARIRHSEAPSELVAFSVYRDTVATVRGLTMLTAKDPFPFTGMHLPLEEVSPELVQMVPVPITLGAQEVRLEWDEQLSVKQLPFGDAFQHETYVRQAKDHLRQFQLEQDWTRSVVEAMKATPGTGVALGEVASMLNTSVRTLQRRLEQHGRTFRQLRGVARFELATDLLTSTNISVSEISRRLGYEEPASFTVAFKRWSGRSPSQYRVSPPPQR
ncbi:helix-turn-helix domain-containing protein [Paenarthrobacter sp. CC6]|uniref:AraC family transcriptional regulator n=1 Tax=Paenarthrobacter sp. CC6 TaxID=3029184 RepID=UPI00339D2648